MIRTNSAVEASTRKVQNCIVAALGREPDGYCEETDDFVWYVDNDVEYAVLVGSVKDKLSPLEVLWVLRHGVWYGGVPTGDDHWFLCVTMSMQTKGGRPGLYLGINLC